MLVRAAHTTIGCKWTLQMKNNRSNLLLASALAVGLLVTGFSLAKAHTKQENFGAISIVYLIGRDFC